MSSPLSHIGYLSYGPEPREEEREKGVKETIHAKLENHPWTESTHKWN